MSYCVNCGVELSADLQECPLCNTPVINPRELEKKVKEHSFPVEKGQVEAVKRRDMGILLSIVTAATAVTCGFLNLLVYDSSLWSLAIIGACALLWVLLIPVVIYTKLPVYLYLLFDGVMVGIYLYMITFMTAGTGWFWSLAFPITVLAVVVAEIFALCVRCFPIGFLTTSLYIFTAVGVFCCGLEILIDRYLYGEVWITWSAVVLTVCVIIDAALITLLSVKRFRSAVRRRLHF